MDIGSRATRTNLKHCSKKAEIKVILPLIKHALPLVKARDPLDMVPLYYLLPLDISLLYQSKWSLAPMKYEPLARIPAF